MHPGAETAELVKRYSRPRPVDLAEKSDPIPEFGRGDRERMRLPACRSEAGGEDADAAVLSWEPASSDGWDVDERGARAGEGREMGGV